MKNAAAMSETGAALVSGRFLVDGHVHIYPSYDERTFLSAAVTNLDREAQAIGLPARQAGVLLLTESRNHDFFRRWRTGTGPGAGWNSVPGADGRSLLVERNGIVRLVVVAGRQLDTTEGLEVHALACSKIFPDVLNLGDTIAAVRDAGAVPALPWGFGKWWGRRRRFIEKHVETAPGIIFLSDSGLRMRPGLPPRLFRTGRDHHVLTLAGSDPLPMRYQHVRAGSYGFVVDGHLSRDRPGDSMHTLLLGLTAQPLLFGSREGPIAFLRDQLSLRLAGSRSTDRTAS
jgi:hypothetical protein